MSLRRSALAGAAAATAWGLQEPLDTRVFRSDYSDVAMLGKLVTRRRGWRPAGLALHAANGAAFGLALEAGSRVTGLSPRKLAIPAALAEHALLYPLSALSDRYHPARGGAGCGADLTQSARVRAGHLAPPAVRRSARALGVDPRAPRRRPEECRARDTRNVARANDAEPAPS